MKVKYFTPGLIKQTLLNIMLKPISNKGPDLIVTIIILKLLGEVWILQELVKIAATMYRQVKFRLLN